VAGGVGGREAKGVALLAVVCDSGGRGCMDPTMVVGASGVAGWAWQAASDAPVVCRVVACRCRAGLTRLRSVDATRRRNEGVTELRGDASRRVASGA
jgi:hypothetical protein